MLKHRAWRGIVLLLLIVLIGGALPISALAGASDGEFELRAPEIDLYKEKLGVPENVLISDYDCDRYNPWSGEETFNIVLYSGGQKVCAAKIRAEDDTPIENIETYQDLLAAGEIDESRLEYSDFSYDGSDYGGSDYGESDYDGFDYDGSDYEESSYDGSDSAESSHAYVHDALEAALEASEETPGMLMSVAEDYFDERRPRLLGPLFENSNEIRCVEFVSSLRQAPSEAWDVSALEDGSVLAWAEQQGDGCTLYIGAEGGVKANPNSADLFEFLPSLEEVRFNGSFDTSRVIDMTEMFANCNMLTSLDLSSFDTSSVISMNYMFGCCYALRELNLDGFDTSSVRDMAFMFESCCALNALDLTSFDTSQVGNMSYMFSNCSVSKLDLTSFDTSSVIEMDMMFIGCVDLQSILVSDSFVLAPKRIAMMEDCGVRNVTYVDSKGAEATLPWFQESSESGPDKGVLKSFSGAGMTPAVSYLDKEDVGEIHFLSDTFDAPPDAEDFSEEGDWSVLAWVEALDTELEEGNFALYIAANGGVKANMDSYGLFVDYVNLRALDFNDSFDTSAVKSMDNMFSGCGKLAALDLSGFDTGNVVAMREMFKGCASLTELDLSNFDSSKVFDMTGMFEGCSKLTKLNLSGLDTSRVEHMSSMFDGCYNLAALDVGDFDTRSVQDMEAMFCGCNSLTELDVSGFDCSNVYTMKGMFSMSDGLRRVRLGKLNTGSVEDMSEMFQYCEQLTDIDLSGLDMRSVETTYSMFRECTSLARANLRGLDMGSARNMNGMFYGCSALKSVDLRGVDTSGATDMAEMFYGCESLTSLDLKDFNTLRVQDMSNMFIGCESLREIRGRKNLALLGCTEGMFEYCGTDHITYPANSKPADPRTLRGGVMLGGGSDASPHGIYSFFENADFSDLEFIGYPRPERIDITAIYFHDTLNEMTTFNFDLSAARDGSVRGWLDIPSESATSYALHIGSTGRVVASPNCFALFAHSTFLTRVVFNGCFDTSQVEDMSYMFYNCMRMESVDIESLDCSSVRNMRYMFAMDFMLRSLDVSGLDTRKVTNMSHMFEGCMSLSNLKLRPMDAEGNVAGGAFNAIIKAIPLISHGFDTSNVTDFSYMFTACRSFVALDLRDFDTSKARSMEEMFSYCDHLERIFVPDGFLPDGVETNRMFHECKTQELIYP